MPVPGHWAGLLVLLVCGMLGVVVFVSLVAVGMRNLTPTSWFVIRSANPQLLLPWVSYTPHSVYRTLWLPVSPF